MLQVKLISSCRSPFAAPGRWLFLAPIAVGLDRAAILSNSGKYLLFQGNHKPARLVDVLDGEVFRGQHRLELREDALKSGRAPHSSGVEGRLESAPAVEETGNS